jgi:hypothetical protein
LEKRDREMERERPSARERERKFENLRMIGYIGIDWRVSSELLGTRALKEGAV